MLYLGMRLCVLWILFPQLHAIGVLCGLMPSSNIQNHDKVLISRIASGITLVQKEGKGSHMTVAITSTLR